MKKVLYLFPCIFLLLTVLSVNVFGASVVPGLHPGNDANSYTPPEGCIRTTLPQSDEVGTHVYKFNDSGQLDASGTNTLTIEVGIAPSTSYTQVLSWSWSGSYPLYSIIVKGGDAFNEYVYDGAATSDTNLVSPINASGHPADISHVSVVLCPEGVPPTPSPSPTPSAPPTPCPSPGPPGPPGCDTHCCVLIVVLEVVAVFLLVAILIGLIDMKRIIRHKKHCWCKDERSC